MALATDTPQLTCRRATEGLNWQLAEATDALHILRQDASESLCSPTYPTIVRCLWDDENLYVAFEARCLTVWATKTRRDDDLWNENVVEVFLDVEGDGRRFFEFQVNPLGMIYDSFVPDAARNEEWQRWSQWNCDGLAVSVVDNTGLDMPETRRGWSATLAIPLPSLTAEVGGCVEPGTVWRANFCRYRYPTPASGPELSCWAPAVKTHDDLPRFGRLMFED